LEENIFIFLTLKNRPFNYHIFHKYSLSTYNATFSGLSAAMFC
jgi:hypothetical protein